MYVLFILVFKGKPNQIFPMRLTMFNIFVLSTLIGLAVGRAVDFPGESHPFLGNIYPNGRIVGGVQTDISKVPYQLALELNGRQFCGASILTPSIAITASHCLDRMSVNGMAVRTGSSKRQTGGSVHKVSKYLMHPSYNRATTDYDVGLLFLSTPITLGSNSKTISIIDREPTTGRLLLSGWGDLKENANQGSPNLMSVEVSIVARASCEKSYASAVKITSRMFCGSAPGKDSCQGDSGGPAVTNGKLAGVVSFGIGCARPNYPGVYTNLANSSIRDWIRTNARV